MKNFAELVNIKVNNKECVILEVKEDAFIDLISLGCFSGNEYLIRVTKGNNHTITVWDKNKGEYSWSWGEDGYTMVCDSMTKMRNIVYDALVNDFDIVMEGSKINTTLGLDITPKPHTYKVMAWTSDIETAHDIVVHKDDIFLKIFKTYEDVCKFFKGKEINVLNTYRAKTGCYVEVWEA